MSNNEVVNNFDIVTTHYEGKKFPDCRCDTCYEKAYYESDCNSSKLNKLLKKNYWLSYLRKIFC